MCYLSKPSDTSHFVTLFLAHEDVVVGFAIFHIELSTPRLACFICSSLILQESWSDHCNLNKKRKKAVLYGMWKLVGTRWNRLAMVCEGKVGRSAKFYKRAQMCQFFKELGMALNLFSMEDSKNPIASRWQEITTSQNNFYFCFTNEKL
jgi:hypothetical protein